MKTTKTINEIPYSIVLKIPNGKNPRDYSSTLYRADLVYTDVNEETDTCFVLKSRYHQSQNKTISLSRLKEYIDETIRRYNENQRDIEIEEFISGMTPDEIKRWMINLVKL